MKDKRPSVILPSATMLVALHVHAGGTEIGSAPVATYRAPAQVTGTGGASMTAANGLSLEGTVGDVGSPTMTGANGISIASGFWPVLVQLTGDKIFASGFETAP